MVDDARQTLERVSAAFAEEISRHDPDAAIPWPLWPDVRTMIDHLGRNHLWAAAIVRTGAPVDRATLSRAPASGVRYWYESCRTELLSALDSADPEASCWVIGGRPGGTARVWVRRMAYETTKHLIDVRASGGGTFTAAPELSADSYADVLDEFWEVFLSRSRGTLAPLPGSLALVASDIDRRWTILPDWQVLDGGDAGTTVTASAGDLALCVWERGDPLTQKDRYVVTGDADTVRAFAAAPIHP